MSDESRATDAESDSYNVAATHQSPNTAVAAGDVGSLSPFINTLNNSQASLESQALVPPAEEPKLPNVSLGILPDSEGPQNWLIQQQIASRPRLSAEAATEVPRQNQDSTEPATRPQIPLTTALPASVNPQYLPSAPGIATPTTPPKAGSYGSSLPTATPFARRVPTTGLDSRNLNLSNPVSDAKPGVFRGNTLYVPGTKPTLSTSLPGTAPETLRSTAQPLGTQLPPDRTVKAVAPRTTGIINPRTPPK